MDIKTAREVAARIWRDPEMGSVEMDVNLAEAIAWLLVGLKKVREPTTSVRSGSVLGHILSMRGIADE